MNERKDLLDHTCVWPRRACLFVPPYDYDERNRNAYDRKIVHFEETAAYQVKCVLFAEAVQKSFLLDIDFNIHL